MSFLTDQLFFAKETQKKTSKNGPTILSIGLHLSKNVRVIFTQDDISKAMRPVFLRVRVHTLTGYCLHLQKISVKKRLEVMNSPSI